MTKLCPRGKSAAKRKFAVYPSAYANAYASKICAGKIKDPSGVKRKDFKGRKPSAMGGRINKSNGGSAMTKNVPNKFKGFSKLPEGVQNKISPSLAKKYESGGRVVGGVMGRGQGKVIKHKKTQIV
jgi:hypothetical protein